MIFIGGKVNIGWVLFNLLMVIEGCRNRLGPNLTKNRQPFQIASEVLCTEREGLAFLRQPAQEQGLAAL